MMSKTIFELLDVEERVTIGPLRNKEYLVIPPDYVVPKIEPQYVMTTDARNQLDMRHFFQIAYLTTQVFKDGLKDGEKDTAFQLLMLSLCFC